MIFGLSDDQQEHTPTKVDEILKLVCRNSEPLFASCRKLGSPEPEVSRPVKVCFHRSDDGTEIKCKCQDAVYDI